MSEQEELHVTIKKDGGQEFTFRWTRGKEKAVLQAIEDEARKHRGFDWLDAWLAGASVTMQTAKVKK